MEHFVFTHNVKIALGCLYSFLVILVCTLKIMQLKGKNVENWFIRTKSFIFLTVIFNVAFLFNKVIAFAFLALVSYLCLKEFLSLIPTRKTDRRVLLLVYWTIPIQLYIIYINWITLFYLFIPLYVFILLSTGMVLTGNTDGFLKNLAVLQYGLMSTVYSIGYLGLLAVIPFAANPIGGSCGLLFYILVLTVANDFMQMFVGKAFGKHKIIPKISPNKTWEGFLGGVVATTIFSAFMGPFLTPMSVGTSVVAGFILAVFGFFGDVTMSAIKRDLGVKDTSSLIPGHGGILDRLDSLIFTAPIFFHYIAYTYNIAITRG